MGKQITAEITNSENEEEVLRKKLALLLSTSFKDVILNGVSPLSLPNAQANGLGYIKLFGKAENLNFINKNTMTPNCYINASGVFVNSQNLDVTDYIEVTAGKLYHYTATTYGVSPCLAYYDSNKELLGTILMSNAKDYTPTTGTKYVRLSIYKATLEVASFSEDVSPTNPVPIMCNNSAVGWTIEPVNLINKNTLTPNCYINASGVFVNSQNLDVTDYIEVTAGKLYHYTATTYGVSPCLAYYDSNKELLGTILMANVKDYTPTTGTKYVRLSIYKTTLEVASFTQDVLQTETISMNGQTATAQNLLSCGDDYVDEHNITTGEVIRKVGYIIINGTENWLSYSATSATGYMYRRINPQADATTFDLISTHFKSTTRAIANMVIGEARCVGQSIYVCAEQDTVENFKTWLANQSTNGTPVIFVYAKATPTTETVTPQTNIQTVAGNNTLTITQAAVDMLKMEVKYKAKG